MIMIIIIPLLIALSAALFIYRKKIKYIIPTIHGNIISLYKHGKFITINRGIHAPAKNKVDKNKVDKKYYKKGTRYKCNNIDGYGVSCLENIMNKKDKYDTITYDPLDNPLGWPWQNWGVDDCCDKVTTCKEWWKIYNDYMQYYKNFPNRNNNDNLDSPKLSYVGGWDVTKDDLRDLSCPPHSDFNEDSIINDTGVLGQNIYNIGNLGSVSAYDKHRGVSMSTNEETMGFHKCCIDKVTKKKIDGFYKSCKSLNNICPSNKHLETNKEPIWVSYAEYYENKNATVFQKRFENICCK